MHCHRVTTFQRDPLQPCSLVLLHRSEKVAADITEILLSCCACCASCCSFRCTVPDSSAFSVISRALASLSCADTHAFARAPASITITTGHSGPQCAHVFTLKRMSILADTRMSILARGSYQNTFAQHTARHGHPRRHSQRSLNVDRGCLRGEGSRHHCTHPCPADLS